MKKIIFSLVMALIPLSVPSYSWGITDAEAINISGRQRMLTQRMMKNYLLIGADVKADKASGQLDDAVALFEEQFLKLRDYSPTNAISSRLDSVESLWIPHRSQIIGQPSRQDLQPLLQTNLALLKACDDVVKEIEKYAQVESARLVNISGRQRMLSQKIAKVYTALYWRVDSPELKTEFAAAIDLFEQSLTELEGYTDNTPELKDSLRKVRNQWNFSQSGFNLESTGTYVPTVISVTTESILKKMDEITMQYQQLMMSKAGQLASAGH